LTSFFRRAAAAAARPNHRIRWVQAQSGVGLGDLALIADVREVLFAAARVVIQGTEEEYTGRDCPAIATDAARERDLALVPVVEIDLVTIHHHASKRRSAERGIAYPSEDVLLPIERELNPTVVTVKEPITLQLSGHRPTRRR